MAKHFLMKCGHWSDAKNGQGKPVCRRCIGENDRFDKVDSSMTIKDGRYAFCTECGVRVLSRPSLYRFKHKSGDYDTFYCGCKGGRDDREGDVLI